MLDALTKLWHVIQYLGTYIEIGIVNFINWFFEALTEFMEFLVNLLPPMPPNIAGLIGLGAPEWVKWLNWAYPIGAFVAIWVTLLTLWLAFLPIRAGLRWVKLA